MYCRRKKTKEQVSRELYERIKPFVDMNIAAITVTDTV